MRIKIQNTEIEVFSIEINEVIDRITEKTCDVKVTVSNDKAAYTEVLTGFTYIETWEDIDITNWVNEELEKYEVI